MEDAVQPTTPLKLSAIAFVVLWTGWMVWSSGSSEPANFVILTACGCVGGYFWYRIMRWCFRLMRLLPDSCPGAAR